jgi:hypothetical protein
MIHLKLCNDLFWFFVSLTDNYGRISSINFSNKTPLSVAVKARAGFFTPGSALAFADAFACTAAEVCDYATTQEQVKLS